MKKVKVTLPGNEVLIVNEDEIKDVIMILRDGMRATQKHLDIQGNIYFISPDWITEIPENKNVVRIPEGGESGYFLEQWRTTWAAHTSCATFAPTTTIPLIIDEQKAQNFAKAMNILFELKACDGVVDDDFEGVPYSIYYDEYMGVGTRFVVGEVEGSWQYNLSPLYTSGEHAQAAIDKVGAENIRNMFRWFHLLGDAK